ncbi:MAG: hypothetical protein IKT52_02500 [Oscillospiraceae bacterium]|nr:hypothetical protein [Oscillospiraceae bacterium]
MKTSIYFGDALNLRDSILLITNYIRDQGRADDNPRNIVTFLNLLFKELPLKDENNTNIVMTMQKMFSGNVLPSKLSHVIDNIVSGKWNTELLRSLDGISRTLFDITSSDSFYKMMMEKVSLCYFSKDEYATLQYYLDAKKYDYFLLVIIIHGFNTLFNLPCFYADRMYDEALTYDYDSPVRFELMHIAAEKGNKNAALEYGNFIAKKGPYPEAFRFLLMAFPLPAAIWNAAFLLENHLVGADQLAQFKSVAKIDEKLSSDEFNQVRAEIDCIICNESNPLYQGQLLYAYRSYFYLAYKGFFKGFNSMAKLLGRNQVSIIPSEDKYDAHSLVSKYSQKAICGGNIMAMCSEGSGLLKTFLSQPADEFPPQDERYMLEVIQTSAEAKMVRSNFNLGNYYEHLLNTSNRADCGRSEIRKIYEKALLMDVDGSIIKGNLLYRLGCLANNNEEKLAYFSKALEAGAYDAAHRIALILFEKYLITGQRYVLLKASSMLNENIPYMTPKVRTDAQMLQEEIKELFANQ